MEDAEIIELFTARDERAVAEVKAKYSGLCGHVALSMLRDKEDAEECISDVYMILWNNIPPAPDNLKAYICRLTKNMCLKRIEYNSAEKRNGKSTLSVSELGEDLRGEDFAVRQSDMELGEIISSFLRSQKPRCGSCFCGGIGLWNLWRR